MSRLQSVFSSELPSRFLSQSLWYSSTESSGLQLAICRCARQDKQGISRLPHYPDLAAGNKLNATLVCRLEEFEAWEGNFKQSVRENTDRGALELGVFSVAHNSFTTL